MNGRGKTAGGPVPPDSQGLASTLVPGKRTPNSSNAACPGLRLENGDAAPVPTIVEDAAPPCTRRTTRAHASAISATSAGASCAPDTEVGPEIDMGDGSLKLYPRNVPVKRSARL